MRQRFDSTSASCRWPWYVGSLAAVFALGCGRPSVRVMCHNANCTGPPDPSRDDTLEALGESLALEHHGRPLLDGVEIDVFWHADGNGGTGRCVFAHDIDTATDSVDAVLAGQAIASYLQVRAPRSFDGGPFIIRMELKGSVGAFGDEHTDEQARNHADCALDLYELWASTASSAGNSIIVVFDSSEPRLLRAVSGRPRWPGQNPAPAIEVWQSADFVDSTPSGLALQKLEEFPAVDDVLFHAGWLTAGHYQVFRSLDVNLTLWMFSATVESFDAIERLEPDVVLTSEAPLVRRWLEH